MENRFKVYCDGGSRGNPGPASCAYVIMIDDKVVEEGGRYLGIATNNAAEYHGAIEGLKKLSTMDVLPAEIVFVHDSELIARQLMGVYKIKNENLRALYLQAKTIEKTLPSKIKYISVPRAHNKVADFLVNKYLDDNISK
jgi:ribonuclease HI